jgi:hypothetical protein
LFECRGAGLVTRRGVAAMGVVSRTMGGAVVEVVGLGSTCGECIGPRAAGAGVPRSVGACREAAPALAMVRGWRRAVQRAEGIARA